MSNTTCSASGLLGCPPDAFKLEMQRAGFDDWLINAELSRAEREYPWAIAPLTTMQEQIMRAHMQAYIEHGQPMKFKPCVTSSYIDTATGECLHPFQMNQRIDKAISMLVMKGYLVETAGPEWQILPMPAHMITQQGIGLMEKYYGDDHE